MQNCSHHSVEESIVNAGLFQICYGTPISATLLTLASYVAPKGNGRPRERVRDGGSSGGGRRAIGAPVELPSLPVSIEALRGCATLSCNPYKFLLGLAFAANA